MKLANCSGGEFCTSGACLVNAMCRRSAREAAVDHGWSLLVDETRGMTLEQQHELSRVLQFPDGALFFPLREAYYQDTFEQGSTAVKNEPRRWPNRVGDGGGQRVSVAKKAKVVLTDYVWESVDVERATLAGLADLVPLQMALILDAKKIAGCALDTTDPEPLPDPHPLRRRDNVIINPHAAWYSEQAGFKGF